MFSRFRQNYLMWRIDNAVNRYKKELNGRLHIHQYAIFIAIFFTSSNDPTCFLSPYITVTGIKYKVIIDTDIHDVNIPINNHIDDILDVVIKVCYS